MAHKPRTMGETKMRKASVLLTVLAASSLYSCGSDKKKKDDGLTIRNESPYYREECKNDNKECRSCTRDPYNGNKFECGPFYPRYYEGDYEGRYGAPVCKSGTCKVCWNQAYPSNKRVCKTYRDWRS